MQSAWHDWHDSAIVATAHQVLLLSLPSSSLLPVPRRTPERNKTSGIKSDVVQVVYDRELALRTRRTVAEQPAAHRQREATQAAQMASLFSSARLTSAYTALRGELGAPQTATDTIDKLVERIQTAALVEDRRTAVLGLKGLSRDWREVGRGRTRQASQLTVLRTWGAERCLL